MPAGRPAAEPAVLVLDVSGRQVLLGDESEDLEWMDRRRAIRSHHERGQREERHVRRSLGERFALHDQPLVLDSSPIPADSLIGVARELFVEPAPSPASEASMRTPMEPIRLDGLT